MKNFTNKMTSLSAKNSTEKKTNKIYSVLRPTTIHKAKQRIIFFFCFFLKMKLKRKTTTTILIEIFIE